MWSLPPGAARVTPCHASCRQGFVRGEQTCTYSPGGSVQRAAGESFGRTGHAHRASVREQREDSRRQQVRPPQWTDGATQFSESHASQDIVPCGVFFHRSLVAHRPMITVTVTVAPQAVLLVPLSFCLSQSAFLTSGFQVGSPWWSCWGWQGSMAGSNLPCAGGSVCCGGELLCVTVP